MIKNIIIDCLLGLIFILIFSYAIHNQKNKNNSWSNSLIFICFAPTLYVYLLYLVLFRSNNLYTINGFLDNCLYGIILTIIVIFLTYLLFKLNIRKIYILSINIILALIFQLIYFYFKLYNLNSVIL